MLHRGEQQSAGTQKKGTETETRHRNETQKREGEQTTASLLAAGVPVFI